VGAAVLIVTVTEVALVVAFGAKLHWASLGKPEQLYVTGRSVVELEPLVTTKPVELVTVSVTGPLVWPCPTVSVPPLRLEVSEKLLVTEVTAGVADVETRSEASPP
jgi:hypothetical protein